MTLAEWGTLAIMVALLPLFLTVLAVACLFVAPVLGPQWLYEKWMERDSIT